MKHITIFSLVLLFTACTTTQVKEDPFTVDIRSPRIPISTIEAHFDRFLNIGGLTANEIIVEYFPLEDAVSLQFKAEFVTYHQFWNSTAREAFISALEQYNQDFQQRNLNTRNSKKTARKYGLVPTYITWQATRFSVLADGNTEIEIGYRFRNADGGRAAFFTLTQREVYYEDQHSREDNRTSQNLMIYFTRIQAEQLAEIFDPAFIQTLRSGESTEASQPGIEFDVY